MRSLENVKVMISDAPPPFLLTAIITTTSKVHAPQEKFSVPAVLDFPTRIGPSSPFTHFSPRSLISSSSLRVSRPHLVPLSDLPRANGVTPEESQKSVLYRLL